MQFETKFEIDAEKLLIKDENYIPDVSANFTISPNNKGKFKDCAPSIKGKLFLLKKNYYLKIAHYSLFVIAVAMINIIASVRFITRLISGDIDPNKV